MNDSTSPSPRQPSTAAGPAARGLACASCQQRKVKCDRLYPCNNCTRRGERCVPGVAVLPRQRRRRFAERELLERLRHYEGLLRENKIDFEPLHKDQPGTKSLTSSNSPTALPSIEKEESVDDDLGTRPLFNARSYWTTVREKHSAGWDDEDSDEDSDETYPMSGKIADIWASLHQKNGFILPFGKPTVPIDLSSQHPDQVTIFKLWQTYLDNVNPLLKITHTPTLQPRIINAGSNVATITPSLNALMFSIYCISILTLPESECETLFGTSKDAILMHYQVYCQQALANCGILRTNEREALVALFLYLLSLAPNMDPHSISSLLGIAVRIAQRMSLHDESSYNKMPALEAELRRRLWWSLVLFDTRMGELSSSSATTILVPTWDCHVPLNVNDFELQDDMQSSPKASSTISEAIFPAVRSEQADTMRNASYYLNFINPALKLIGKRNQKFAAPLGEETAAQAKELEDKYLVFCNPENSIHFMTMWLTRVFITKQRLMEHYSNIAADPAGQTDNQRDAATEQALIMLDGDTQLMTNPIAQGFRWYLYLYLPLPAYFQILLDLRKRPLSGFADRAWQAMNDHFDARSFFEHTKSHHVYNLLSKLMFQAWQSCANAAAAQGRTIPIPQLIEKLNYRADEFRQAHTQPDVSKLVFEDNWQSAKIEDPALDLTFDAGLGNLEDLGLDAATAAPMFGNNMDKFDWDTMDWNPLLTGGW